MRVGGSTLKEVTEVAVRPRRLSPMPVVMMVTPAMSDRMPSLNSFAFTMPLPPVRPMFQETYRGRRVWSTAGRRVSVSAGRSIARPAPHFINARAQGQVVGPVANGGGHSLLYSPHPPPP